MSIANDLARLERRLQRFMLAVAVLGFAAAQIRFGWRVSVGFLLGSIASWWNFRSLQTLVRSLGTSAGVSGLETTAWMLFRLIALALGAFVIMRAYAIKCVRGFYGTLRIRCRRHTGGNLRTNL